MAGVTEYEKQLLKKFESFIREFIFEPQLDIKQIGLFIDSNSEMSLCLEVLWKNLVSEEQKKEIELDIKLRIMEEFPELRGVEFFKAAGPVVIKVEKVEKGLILLNGTAKGGAG